MGSVWNWRLSSPSSSTSRSRDRSSPETPSWPCAALPAGGGKRGAYFWVVKENHPTLRQDIAGLWDLAPLPPPQAVQTTPRRPMGGAAAVGIGGLGKL